MRGCCQLDRGLPSVSRVVVVLAAVVLILCLPSAAAEVQVTPFKVGPDGDWPAVQSAIDEIGSGVAVQVRVEVGTYNEHIEIPSSIVGSEINLSGGWNSSFSSQSEGPSLTEKRARHAFACLSERSPRPA